MLIDQGGRCENDFRAAAANVATATSRPETSNARVTLRNANRASSSDEMTSISSASSSFARRQKSGRFGVADGARGDGPHLLDAVAGGDGLESLERGDRCLDSGRGQLRRFFTSAARDACFRVLRRRTR